MAAELRLSVWLFDSTVQEHFAAYQSLPKAVGLAGQAVFALIPLLQRGKREHAVWNYERYCSPIVVNFITNAGDAILRLVVGARVHKRE